MARKFDFNGTHVPPPYMDRSFNGSEVMISRASANEAPEVSTYDYNSVENFTGLEGMTTDFSVLEYGQNTTSLYGDNHGGGKINYDTDTLLNDAWFCIQANEGGKLYSTLCRLKNMGIPFPADHKFTTMFGTATLWEKVNDRELKMLESIRSSAIELLSRFHS